LAGTQNQQHKSQPAKELTFCSTWVTVFRWTQLKCKSLITDRGKDERTTKVLLQAGRDVETIGCSSLSASVPADGILLGFCRLSCALVFQSASVPGLDGQ